MVRVMASRAKKVNKEEKEGLMNATSTKDVKTLTSLLQKGVCPNLRVYMHEKKRERM